MTCNVGLRESVQICMGVFCATLLWFVLPSNMELPQQQKIPRLADGRPDLQGNWDYSSIIPLERPLTDRGNQLLASPAISLDRESSPDLSAEYTESATPMAGSSRSEAWPGVKPGSNRGSLITLTRQRAHSHVDTPGAKSHQGVAPSRRHQFGRRSPPTN